MVNQLQYMNDNGLFQFTVLDYCLYTAMLIGEQEVNLQYH
jgi:hypothetical protein